MDEIDAFCAEMEEEDDNNKELANHVTLIYAQSLGQGDFK